jgi:hypothetical protein
MGLVGINNPSININISTALTFPKYTLKNMIALMKFAPKELDMLKNIPVHSYQLLIFFITPLIVTIIILIIFEIHITSGNHHIEMIIRNQISFSNVIFYRFSSLIRFIHQE